MGFLLESERNYRKFIRKMILRIKNKKGAENILNNIGRFILWMIILFLLFGAIYLIARSTGIAG